MNIAHDSSINIAITITWDLTFHLVRVIHNFVKIWQTRCENRLADIHVTPVSDKEKTKKSRLLFSCFNFLFSLPVTLMSIFFSSFRSYFLYSFSFRNKIHVEFISLLHFPIPSSPFPFFTILEYIDRCDDYGSMSMKRIRRYSHKIISVMCFIKSGMN